MPNNYTGQAAFQGNGSVNSDGLRVSNTGSLVVSQLHGKYAEQCVRGNLFLGTTAVGGIALITTATTGNHPTIWNPLGSGVNVVLARLSLTYLSGNNAPGGLGWYKTASTGSSIGTGNPIVTFTDVAPVNALVGGAKTSAVRWAPAVCTFTAAPAFLMQAGISLTTMVAASTVQPFTVSVDYDGMKGIAPGSALSLCSTAATTTAVFLVELEWEEVPV